jgi:hypothetical protein
MPLLRSLLRGLRSLVRKEQVDRELDEEVGAYLEMAAAEKMKDGLSHKEALRAVRVDTRYPVFSSVPQIASSQLIPLNCQSCPNRPERAERCGPRESQWL